MARDVQLRDTRKYLTGAMRRGAFLDSQGKNRGEIASACGVTVETVSEWRREQKYQDEIARYIGAELAPFEQRVQLALADWVDVIEQTRETVLELLVMEREDGTPNVGARVEAAKIVVNHPATKRLLGMPEESKGQISANATVTLIVHRDGETIEVHEGEYEEVNDGHREEDRRDGDQAGADQAALPAGEDSGTGDGS